jgi:hypothetical protein
MWRAGFGRDFGPVVRQTANWMIILDSGWWTVNLSETRRVIYQNKFDKQCISLGFIIRILINLFFRRAVFVSSRRFDYLLRPTPYSRDLPEKLTDSQLVKETPRNLRNQKVHYRVYKCPPIRLVYKVDAQLKNVLLRAEGKYFEQLFLLF